VFTIARNTPKGLVIGVREALESPGVSPLVSYVVQTVMTLAGVGALALLLVFGARRAGVGRATGPLSVVGRLPLDARRAVYLVRVGRTIYVIGASETGLVKLGEIPETELSAGPLGDARNGP
jgi:flagellar biogenesis protein FliO